MTEDLLIAKLTMIVSQIQHEDDLIGQRTSWLVVSQSFLFGTFVAVIGLHDRTGMAHSFARLLFVIIPFVGMLLPIVVLLAVGAAASAIRQWRFQHDHLCATPEGKALDWPRLQHQTRTVALGHLLPITVAVGFMLAWIIIAITLGLV